MGGSLGVLGSQKVRLSVIVPVYNVAPYLRGCLDSIVAAVEKCSGEVRDTSEVEVTRTLSSSSSFAACNTFNVPLIFVST